jgi:hypothetical protein
MQEIIMHGGIGKSSRNVYVHDIHRQLDLDLIDVLPVLHALSSSDTTSKVGTKISLLKHVTTVFSNMIRNFIKRNIWW